MAGACVMWDTLHRFGEEACALMPAVTVVAIVVVFFTLHGFHRRLKAIERGMTLSVNSKIPEYKEQVDRLSDSVRQSELRYEETKTDNGRMPLPMASQ